MAVVEQRDVIDFTSTQTCASDSPLKLPEYHDDGFGFRGKVAGETCGLTVLGHPQNFRFPQPIRAHPSAPFFCFAPQQLGEMEITPGQKYIARYRLVIADGEPAATAAAAWWDDYAQAR